VPILLAFAGLAWAQNQNPLVSSGKTREVAEHIYVIPDQRVNLVPNIGIIVGRDGVLVVDTGMGPKNASTVLSEVKKITSERIAYCDPFPPRARKRSTVIPSMHDRYLPHGAENRTPGKGCRYYQDV
jgi:hypothetical protein